MWLWQRGKHQHAAEAQRQEGAGPRWGAPYWTQVSILFLRAVKTRRFESLSTQDIVQFVIVGALSGVRPPPCLVVLPGYQCCRVGMCITTEVVSSHERIVCTAGKSLNRHHLPVA